MELGQNLTKEEIASLSSKFSLDEPFVNLHKIDCCTNNAMYFSVWICIPKISIVPISQNQKLRCSFSPTPTPRDGNCLIHGWL